MLLIMIAQIVHTGGHFGSQDSFTSSVKLALMGLFDDLIRCRRCAFRAAQTGKDDSFHCS